MTVPHDQIFRVLYKEVDSDLVQNASRSEIEDDIDPHASKKRPRLQSVPTNNESKEDGVQHVDLNFVEAKSMCAQNYKVSQLIFFKFSLK